MDARKIRWPAAARILIAAMIVAGFAVSWTPAQGEERQRASDEELRADVNAPLLEQAVINLVDNAVKYSDDGGTVWLEAAREEDGVTIHVRDCGCGIGREHLGRIFERFYRVDKARSRKLGGTGLGLAIVKHIAQLHGGRAEVESRLGEGSVFSLRLPTG